MRLEFIIHISAANLKRRKLRTFLTVGGISIGIALIVFLVSLGFGLQRLIKNRIASVEALTVLDVSRGESLLLPLDEGVVKKFNQLDGVEAVSPSISLSGQAVYKDFVTDVAIYGINPQFISMEGIKISIGSNITGEDKPQIIITQTALDLLGITNPLKAEGKKISLKILVPASETNQEAQIKEVETYVQGIITDDEELSIIYAPLKFLQSLGFEGDYSQAKVKVENEALKEYSLARIKVKDESKLAEVRKKIENMGYQVDSVADTVGQVDKIFVIFEIVMAGLGSIAMFVASLGALNTLTVSLLERTREIGILKTLGATRWDIYRLFLSEALLLGLSGGITGIILGWSIGEGLNLFLNYLAAKLGGDQVDIFYTPLSFIFLIIGVILLMSLITGFYPARRAVKINPLDALRYE